ncbi:biopolymer transporter ExbD [Lysobacter sp. SG-8]|uniref:Biopolymer transporter ExbD n=1 Tax=Marilutibacter penaei TaxID=2759900 RepID=A0A7W3U5W3_9GAMM|nr:biopolymer transporter ExbD [Lysobacter penaei]MBB1089185.1 biopolymer transporter ExbD [Lysobacter penaei]
MRIQDHRAFDEPDINLVPLIDVILVLIIFFVVTTTFDARSVLKLQLPTAQGETNDANKALSVLVNADGRYFVDDREVLRDDLESLKATLADVGGDDRDRPVLLRADARTPHQAVVTAYDALGQLGFKRVMIATAPQADGGGEGGP